jgi:two-component sensor histidine kinase
MIRIVFATILIVYSGLCYADTPTYDLRGMKDTVELGGKWGFADGVALSPSQTNMITQTISVPQYLENRPSGAVGIVTYVVDIESVLNKQLSIDFNLMSNAWKLFVDDKLVFESGYIDVEKKIYKASPKRTMVTFTPTKSKTRLTVWVANSQHRHLGISMPPLIAPFGSMEAAHDFAYKIELAVICVLFFGGLYHIGLFVAWRQDKAPLWFGLFLFAFITRISATGEKIITTLIEQISWESVTSVEYIGGYLIQPFFYLYLTSLYPRQKNRYIGYFVIGVAAILILSVLLTSSMHYTSLLPFAEVYLSVNIAFGIFILYRVFMAKEQGSVITFFATLVFGITALHDILTFPKIIYDTHEWLPAGAMLYFAAQAYILIQRYASAFRLLKKHEDELENTVAKRTEELKNLLAQRELLMRELNHRVKNNLQFIIGLLWNKRMRAGNETKKILLSLQSQVQAIATVHEKLSANSDAFLDGAEYLESIVGALRELYPQIEFECIYNGRGVLSMDNIISLGLVISELVSNSVKHSFDDEGGAIKMSFEMDKEVVKFTYTDGKTIFENNDFDRLPKNGSAIGWSMISKLIRQLKAQSSAKLDVFSITFTEDKVIQ